MSEIPIADWPESRRERKDRETWNREEAILVLLTRKGPLNKYGTLKHLPKKLGSKPTILEAIGHLKTGGFIDVATVDRHARGSKGRSEYFDLTLEGLAELITRLNVPDEWKELSRVLTKYHPLLPPPLRELWTALVEAGIEDGAVSGLQLFFALHDSWRGSYYKKVSQHPDEVLEYLLSPDYEKMESCVEWSKRVRRDERLRKAAIEAFQYRVEKLKSVDVVKRIQDMTEFVTWLSDPDARSPLPESCLPSLRVHGP